MVTPEADGMGVLGRSPVYTNHAYLLVRCRVRLRTGVTPVTPAVVGRMTLYRLWVLLMFMMGAQLHWNVRHVLEIFLEAPALSTFSRVINFNFIITWN